MILKIERMKNKRRRWKIEEIVDFEACVHQFHEDIAGDELIRSNTIEPLLEQRPDLEGENRKELAFFSWSRHRLKQVKTDPSEYWVQTYQLFTKLIIFIGFLLGVGSVLGMVNWESKTLNIALMLGVFLFLPWGLFILCWVVSKCSGGNASMSAQWLQNKLKKLLVKRGYSLDRLPISLKTPIARSVFLSFQKASISFGLAGIVSMLCVVFFVDIHFYWESSLGEGMKDVWYEICGVLSLPWAWSGYGVPNLEDVNAVQMIRGEGEESQQVQLTWALFSVGVIMVWSFVPRVLLMLWGKMRLRSALKNVKFEEKGHRQLWRRLYIKKVTSNHTVDEDAAILVDFGGWKFPEEKLRPFLLQRLRLNPCHSGVLGTLDQSNEKELLGLIGEHDYPVIVCCEASEFSPPALQASLQKFRAYRADVEMHVVVVGEGAEHEEEPEWMQVWNTWIDELADTKVRLHRFLAFDLGTKGANKDGND